ncbi:DUF4349 domain-containing protein [Nonomuraea africana]|uniref:DUF4349 domain-containing protein n=1 Tax=Nonomuraea africana TaxID=46171 RepID=UPI0034027B0B
MSRFRYGIALTAAGAALLLSACGGGERAASAPQAVSAAAAPSPARESAETGAGTGEPGQAAQVKIAPEQRSVIYVSRLTVRAKDVTKAADQAKQLVTGAGGYLASEESDASGGGEGSSTLVFKIPPAAYPQVLDKLGKQLGQRVSLQQNTTDVTEEVADVASRLKSAEQALAAMRALLSKADTVGQVIEVEREIAAREAELESLQARQKALASQVAMATLTLRLIGPVAEVAEPSDEPAGFLGGLKAGWSALVGFVKVALTVIGVLLPWLVVIVPLAVGILVLVRRSNARRPAPPRAWAPPAPVAHGAPSRPQPEGAPPRPQPEGAPSRAQSGEAPSRPRSEDEGAPSA